MSAKLIEWLRQPTTVGGIASMMAGAMQYATGGSVSNAATLIAGGVVAMLLPDGSTARTPIEQLLQDGAAAAMTNTMRENLPKITADAAAAFQALAPASAPVSLAAVSPVAPVPASITGVLTNGS